MRLLRYEREQLRDSSRRRDDSTPQQQNLRVEPCDIRKEHATVQYAFLSSIFSLAGRLVGGISGLGTEKYGFANYFAITFLLSMPAYLLLPWVKQWIQEEAKTY